jgi:hypothetical protein
MSLLHFLCASVCQRAIIIALLLLVPGLNDRLARNPAVLQLTHGKAQDFHAIRIGAGLAESELAAVDDTCFDAMSHRATADIIPEHPYRVLAFDFSWFARWIVSVDDPQDSVVVRRESQ